MAFSPCVPSASRLWYDSLASLTEAIAPNEKPITASESERTEGRLRKWASAAAASADTTSRLTVASQAARQLSLTPRGVRLSTTSTMYPADVSIRAHGKICELTPAQEGISTTAGNGP